MAAPGQPQPPVPPRSPWYVSRVLLIIAAVCFLFAALTACGSRILDAPMWGWAFGAFAAWVLAWAVP